MTGAVLVRAIDVTDDAALRAWHAVEAASVAHDRPAAIPRGLDALVAAVRNPSAYHRSVLLAAVRDGDGVVGSAELTLRDQENAHTLELAIHVHPEHRRQGIGRALWAAAGAIRAAEGRTTTFGEVTVPPIAGLAFARGLGFASVHEEEHLILDLPAADPSAVPDPPGYAIVTWAGACPDTLLEAYARLRNQMQADVPLGALDLAATVYTPARIREGEERSARAYERLTAAAIEEVSGELVAYSLVFLPHDSTDALQDDTLVMPATAGTGSGRRSSGPRWRS